MLADPLKKPLQDLDESDPRRFEQNCLRPLFKRLRAESPVRFQAESAAGPLWSVTRFDDIVEVEKNTEIFYSEPSIAIIDQPLERRSRIFITMDQPGHDIQRRAVQPVVGPKKLSGVPGAHSPANGRGALCAARGRNI